MFTERRLRKRTVAENPILSTHIKRHPSPSAENPETSLTCKKVGFYWGNYGLRKILLSLLSRLGVSLEAVGAWKKKGIVGMRNLRKCKRHLINRRCHLLFHRKELRISRWNSN